MYVLSEHIRSIEHVRQTVERSPKRSETRQSLALHISNKTLRRILSFDLRFHPYKTQVVCDLNLVRIVFWRRILENDKNQQNYLFMTGEAHFSFNRLC